VSTVSSTAIEGCLPDLLRRILRLEHCLKRIQGRAISQSCECYFLLLSQGPYPSIDIDVSRLRILCQQLGDIHTLQVRRRAAEIASSLDFKVFDGAARAHPSSHWRYLSDRQTTLCLLLLARRLPDRVATWYRGAGGGLDLRKAPDWLSAKSAVSQATRTAPLSSLSLRLGATCDSLQGRFGLINTAVIRAP